MEQELLDIIKELCQNSNGIQVWIPSIVSIIIVIINHLYYIFVQPNVLFKKTARENLTKVSVELLNYLSEIVSMDEFSGVPTQIRKYSLQIHLQFRGGVAKGQIASLLEHVFEEAKIRKTLSDSKDVEKWNDDFRNIVRKLRIELAKYCGIL